MSTAFKQKYFLVCVPCLVLTLFSVYPVLHICLRSPRPRHCRTLDSLYLEVDPLPSVSAIAEITYILDPTRISHRNSGTYPGKRQHLQKLKSENICGSQIIKWTITISARPVISFYFVYIFTQTPKIYIFTKVKIRKYFWMANH